MNHRSDRHMKEVEPKRERAILVAARFPMQLRWEVEEYLDELAQLAQTAGAEVVGRLVQERRKVDPAYFIGKGKAEQLAELAKKLRADLVIFDDELSPAQVRNLEALMEAKVMDRSGLILDIFARRAKTREAKTQVELAQLQYLLPRLTRRWTHLSRQVGGIGTRGPGETQLEVDRRLIKNRITLLTRELKKIAQQRETRRRRRREIFKVAMVGYTNTGKSTLLNALTNANIATENRLFVTLDPTIRSLKLDAHTRVLLIDTVGFIRKLPHHLVASFRSTLEEAVASDLLLHVVDISHPMFLEQITTVNQVLRELQIDKKPRIMVFNKIDLLEDQKIIPRLREKYQPAVFISATKGYFLQELVQAIRAAYNDDIVQAEFRFRDHVSEVLNEISALGTITDTNLENGQFWCRFRITRLNLARLEDRLRQFMEPRFVIPMEE